VILYFTLKQRARISCDELRTGCDRLTQSGERPRIFSEPAHRAWCCFTSQQAAEKALKALGEHFRHPLFGHNLNVLLNALATYIEIPPGVREACARLNRFYIPTRYPNAFDQGAPVDQFFESDARQALQDAEEVIRFVEAAMGAPRP